MWEDEGLAPLPEPNDEVGQRRNLFRSYEDNVDWSDPVRVARVLRVFEVMLQRVSDDDLDTWRQTLERDGYELSAQRRITAAATPARAVPSASLASLRDPSSIMEQFDRIGRALTTDPALAIGSAKELIEATAKTILVELGLPFDDRTKKLPDLISSAQRGLHLHPSAATAGPDGTDAVKRILGGLSSIAMGVAELRNRGYGTGHAVAGARVGLHTRHAYLAVGAAHTWCQLMIDTFADPAAPWRRTSVPTPTTPRQPAPTVAVPAGT